MSNLTNMRRLTEAFEAKRHPAAGLGEFLIAHSNSTDYLVGALSAYLEAAKTDHASDEAFLSALITAEAGGGWDVALCEPCNGTALDADGAACEPCNGTGAKDEVFIGGDICPDCNGKGVK